MTTQFKDRIKQIDLSLFCLIINWINWITNWINWINKWITEFAIGLITGFIIELLNQRFKQLNWTNHEANTTETIF